MTDVIETTDLAAAPVLSKAELKKIYYKKYYVEHKPKQTKEYKKEYMKSYLKSERGKEVLNNARVRYFDRHPEKKKEIYMKTREHQLEYSKECYQLHRETIRAKANEKYQAKKQAAAASEPRTASVTPSGQALAQLMSALSVREE